MIARIFVGTMGAAALIGCALFTPPANAADPAVIKIGSFTPEKASWLRDIVRPWMKAIEKDSGNAVTFQEFWGGALIRSPRKQYEGMMNGIQDATIVLPAYTQKLFPDFSLLSLPFLFRGTGSEVASVTGWKAYKKDLFTGLDKIYVAAIYTNDNSGMHFNRKLDSLDDIKGLKVRAAGPEEAGVIESLGGTPVGMSITQVAESLNRGVIQGTLNGWSALQTFRITPLIKTHVDLPLGVRSFILSISKRVYDKLPAQARQAIDKHSGLAMSRTYGRYYGRDGAIFRSKATKEGRTVISPDDATLAKLAARFKGLHEEWIRSHKDGQRKYDAVIKIRDEVRAGS